MAHAFYAYTPAWTTYSQEFASSPKQHDRSSRFRRRSLSYRVRVGAATLSVTLCVMMAVLMIALLRHANSVATKGYVIRQLAQERTVLLTQNRVLKQRASELKSLATIENSPLFSGMVPITDGEITYVHHGETVALGDSGEPAN